MKRERGKKKIFPVFRRSELDSLRTKFCPCNESYEWVPKSEFLVEAPRGRVFSYTGSFSLKGRKWLYGTAPTMGLSFRTLGLFFYSSRLGCEGRCSGRLWVSERPEKAFRVGFGSGTAGKCMLDFVCFFSKAEISGLSPDYWSGMTSFAWTVFGMLLMEIELHAKCVENMLIYECLNILA